MACLAIVTLPALENAPCGTELKRSGSAETCKFVL
ncbi:hypothetical protein MGSAQ_002781 [marine sediment metagenome]|uniref:Uncharacterized protein n=1 Tax=marine sediment metagenome TaxID=412755 RepID=A0A1B6NQL4_9ZZZZ